MCILIDGNTCFYGRCLYCKPSEKACANGVIMEGSVTLWLPDWYQLKTWRHPYQRTYVPNVKARYGKRERERRGEEIKKGVWLVKKVVF